MKRLSMVLAGLIAATAGLMSADLLGQNRAPLAAPRAIALPECNLELIDEVQVPAEEAGKLDAIQVREGSIVKAGDILAQIDDSQARVQREAAGYAFEGAAEKARDQIEVTYAIAAAKFAAATCKRDREATDAVKNAVSQTDMERNILDYNRSMLGIDKARHDLKLASFEAQTKSAEVKATDLGIARRKITAPFDGQVVEVYFHNKEWVKPGDALLRLVRLDRLKANAHLSTRYYNPYKVINMPVVIEVPIPGENNKKVSVRGRITSANPSVSGEEFQVTAEFENQSQGNGQWLLLPGLQGTIQVGSAK